MNNEIVIVSDFCPNPACCERMTETDCNAPGCLQLRCDDCEIGCDILTAEDDGGCAKAIEAAETLDWGQGRPLQGSVTT